MKIKLLVIISFLFFTYSNTSAQDCNDPTLITEIPCDDMDPCTFDDIEIVLIADSTICVPCSGFFEFCLVIDYVTCDDGDPTTVNDMMAIDICTGDVCLPCQGDGCPDPGNCDDGICINGIEYWDTAVCDCLIAPGCEYQITSITPTVCAPDSLSPSACNNVCPYNSQVYVVENYNAEITWDVIGAESWEVIGNELLVNWGGPGSGLITASGEGNDDCDLQVSFTENNGVTALVSGGAFPYEYAWYDATGLLLSNGSTYIPNSSETFVNFVLTDGLGCIYSQQYFFTACADLEIVGQTTDVNGDCSEPNGSIELFANNGTAPYIFEWSDGFSAPSRAMLEVGIYQLTVTDANGCQAFGNYAINCTSCQDVAFTYLTPSCDNLGSIIIADFSGGNGIAVITGPNGFTSTSLENTNLVEGIYFASYVTADCAYYEVFDLTSPFSALSANVVSSSDCNVCDGQINFSNYQNLFFNWSNGSTSPFNQNLCEGVYSVTVSDLFQNLCVYEYEVSCEGEPVPSFSTALCIDILEETEAIIATIPEPEIGGDVNICAGQTVYFESQSINAETHIWDFGNGENDSGINTEFTYETPGSYLVQLIARNECLCSDTTSINVNVEQAIIPKLDCAGTVCENTEVTYTTDAECGSYSWIVSGDGTIVDGGGSSDDFITIEWGVGPMGEVALSVTSCTENYCIFENITQIPIIGSNDDIKGKPNVCRGDLQVYTITNYGGTEFIWEVSQFGEIVKGQGTNSVSIQWTDLIVPTSPQWVRVMYENCYLECGGSDEMVVNILDEHFFSGPIELCINETGTYHAERLTGGPALVNWQVKDPTNAVIATGGPAASFDVTLNGALGIYTLTASPSNPGDFCSGVYSAFINLLESPPPVTSILGKTEICVGGTYTYEAISSLSNTSFAWEINDGGLITESGGAFINVTWNSAGPYSLSVYQIENSDAACESESITLNLTKIDDIIILGQQDHCIETTSIFTATAYPDVDYDWMVIPETAATIIEGQQTNTIQVFWHSVGNVTVQMNACGNSDTYNVNINPLPVPMVNHPVALCPEEVGPVSSTTPFSSYEWRDTNGVLISNMSNLDLGPGNYELIVTDNNGCEGNTIFEIQDLPTPTVEISSPNLLTYCPPLFPVPTLFALESDPPYQYQWYRNNVLIPGATMSLYTPPNMESGAYKVEAINEYGCVGTSNILNVQYSCGGGGGPPTELLCQGVVTTFEIENTVRCERHKFLNTSPNLIPGTTDWYFGFPDVEDTATGESVSYDFQRSGFYFVVMICDHLNNGVVERCGLGRLDMIPVSPDFHVLSNCVDSAIEFEDLSTFVPGQSVTSWTWDFGDPASGINNTSTLQDPTHIYSAAGTYEVNLTITGPNGCISEITKSIEIQNPPTPSFDLPIEDCQNFPLDFVANVGATVTDVFWDFGDPASGDANTSEVVNTYHEYESPGVYTITLTAQTIYGCEATYSQQLVIQQNNLSGVISMVPGSPICEGQVSTLSAPAGPFSYIWSTNEIASSIITGEAGVYDVTISDDNGCTYTTPEVILDILPLPGGEIRVVEYDEYDQPISFFYDSYTICEGEEVFMEVNAVDGYEYSWGNGQNGTTLDFTIERDNLLEAGTYVFDVNIVDTETGCSNIAGPYTVLVNENPEDILLVSDPDGFICDNQPATISISNYDPDLTYIWNTGTIDATAIIVDIPGIYYVRAFNDNGCETTSNEIEIHKGPDINRIPSGCHTRCTPDTLCLPSMPGIISWQWFFNDMAIPAPEGQQQEIVATESGDYYVEMLDEFGCRATSGIMTLDLYIGTGTIGGEVYFDVNDNGIIDGPDTLMSNQTIFIEGDGFSDAVTSNSMGAYSFVDILAVDYTLYFDSLSLPVDWAIIESVQQSELVGCDNIEEVNWLVREICLEQFGVESFDLCPDETMMFYDVELAAGDVVDVVTEAFSGCDSIITVTVGTLPIYQDNLFFEACFEEFYNYNGQQILAGESYTFEMTAINGCDSTEVVFVEMLAPTSSVVEFDLCEGEVLEYNGIEFQAGDTHEFELTNVAGCDSLVLAFAIPIPLSYTEVELYACTGDSIFNNGQYLYPNSIQEIQLQGFFGCDSTVEVSVLELGAQPINLDVVVCPSETFTYEGQEFEPGTSGIFNYTSWQGCDSTIYLSVESMPDFALEYETEIICYDETGFLTVTSDPGTGPYLYSLDGINYQPENQFNDLAPGDYTIFIKDELDCIKELPANVPEYERLNVFAENTTMTCDIDSLELNAELVSGSDIDLSFTWPDGSTGSSFYVTTAGTYPLQASNICEDVVQDVVVQPAIFEVENYLYIPNVFSPNGDGNNDKFIITPIDDLTIHSYEIHVFDRWGEAEYFSTDINDGWDGTLKDGHFRPGVHVWWLKMDVTYCGERQDGVFEKGDITVIR